jgi:Asp-tRNA(Asn)/Glu-tRNA(Gln) amidotransferase A subunit family amidase
VTSYGSRLFADNRADHDSELTLRLKRAGLVILGKTNTPEMGLAPSTEPRHFRPTRNPWNLGFSAGGSSGGAAAAVAAGMLPMAHATDGGGSIRIPASACGLFGLKPTRARNPMGPDAGEGWGGASVGHAVTRSVRDSAALLDATSGPDVGDPYWAPPPPGPFLAEVGRAPGRLRVALTVKPWVDVPVDGECAEAARAARGSARASGITWRRRGPRFDASALGQATRTIIGANCARPARGAGRALGRPLTDADVERVTWAQGGGRAEGHGGRLRPGHRGRAPDGARGGALLPRRTTSCSRRRCASRRIASACST